MYKRQDIYDRLETKTKRIADSVRKCGAGRVSVNQKMCIRDRSGHSVADWTLKRSGDAKKSKIRIANKPALNNNSHAKQLTGQVQICV